MRSVKFIRSLVVEEVPLCVGEELRYYQFDKLEFIGEEIGLMLDKKVHCHIAPVHKFSRAFNSGRMPSDTTIIDTFIAYSKEVQELLGMPFDVMNDEMNQLEKEKTRLSIKCHKYENKLMEFSHASFWKRVKFMITGDIEII